MTWEIVAGLILIAGACISLGGVLWKLAVTLTEMRVALRELNCTIKELRDSNAESHKQIWDKIGDHETRIHDLEVNNTAL